MASKNTQSWFSREKEEFGILAQRIKILYNPPREYFTIGIPVAFGILLVLGAFFAGFAFHGTEKVQAGVSEKQKALEELAAQMNEEEGVVNTTQAADTNKAGQKMGLDEILIFAVIIAITPYSIDITLQKRSTRRKEELFTEFLFKLSELMRGGLDPIKSVKELSKTDMGILSQNIRNAATSMVYGKSFEDSMKTMAKNLHSEMIKRYSTLVVQASYSGGYVADLILKASEDMRSIIGIEREKEGNLSQYVVIFYFAEAIIFFILFILTTSLLPFVDQLGPSSPFGVNKLANLDFARGFFHLIIINAFFGGLIIGKISEGEARYGLKHSAILMTVGYIACALFIIPPPVATLNQNLNITAISGVDQFATPMLPLKEPIIFQVTDPDGNPVNQTVVQFSIIPSGSVSPSSDTTDDRGMVQVRVTIGDNYGTYVIMAKADEASGRAIIEAKNMNV